MIKEWLGLHDLDTSALLAFDNIEAWWCSMVISNNGRRKGLASLLMLVSRGSFRMIEMQGPSKNKSTMATIVLVKIKLEARS
jgi:hypothetical protein